MQQRLNYGQHAGTIVQRFAELGNVVKTESNLDPKLIDLVQTRASHLNGCTFCVDMHVKEAKIHGEKELKLYHLPVWRESSLFSEKERAALEWTEELTRLTEKGISDEAYEKVKKHFSEKELSYLTFSIGFINVWNRMSVAFRPHHGSLDKYYGLEKAGLE